MKPLDKIIEAINESTEKYELCKIGDTHTQSEILQSLSANVYFLTEYRIHFHKQWMKSYFESSGGSSAAKERFADNDVPELYTVRHMMASGNKVLDSLRTIISANKNG